jgi:hypothetical protein
MPRDAYHTGPEIIISTTKSMATGVMPSCCCLIAPKIMSPKKLATETEKLQTKLKTSERVIGFWLIA